MTPEQVELLLTGVNNCSVLLTYILGGLVFIITYGIFEKCFKLFSFLFGGR